LSAEMLLAIRLAGLIAILGALVYAVGDTLLLAAKANLADYPKLEPHRKLLSGMERMVVIPPRRLMWGGLLGVFATLAMLVGFWLVYQGLASAGVGLALPPVLLFAGASVVGAFGHGSFIYLGEYVQALNRVQVESQPVLLEMLARHRKIMIIIYAFLLISILSASIWFSVVVAGGKSAFPTWMAAANPVVAFFAWMVIKRLLPKRLVDATEGAGFNIAYLVFFILVTAALW